MYVRNSGNLLAWYTDRHYDSPATTYIYYYDGSGNITELTDANQNVVANYQYDAYGNLLSSTGTQANANVFRYSDKEYIPSVGMYNYGYRFYSPGMGRWINRDPIGENGGDNLYAAFVNDPMNKIDLYGLDVGWASGPNGPWGPRENRQCDIQNNGNDIPIIIGALRGTGEAPNQVTPGIRNLKGIYDPRPNRSAPEPWSAHYDEYGRQIGRTDYTSQPDPSTHTDPHHHVTEYGPGYSNEGYKTGPFDGAHPEDDPVWDIGNNKPKVPPILSLPSLDPFPLFYYDPGMYNSKTRQFEHPRIY